MYVLPTTGTTAQRAAIEGFKAEATSPYDAIIRPVLDKAGRSRISFNWSNFHYYRPRSGFDEVILNAEVVGIVSPSGLMYVDSRLSGDRAKQAVKAAMDKMASYGRDPNKPVPPVVPVDENVVVYDPDAPAYYADEDTDLFHINHVGVEPAEFYPTREEAIANGKVADGVCSA